MEARKKNREGNKETKREGQSKVIKPLKNQRPRKRAYWKDSRDQN